MFLAFREIKHSRVRYLLIGLIMTMVAWLVLLLSGLANGLSTDNASSLMNMKADYLVFQTDSRFSMSRSSLPMELVDTIKQIDGVKVAAPLGQLIITTELSGGTKLDLAVLAYTPDTFLSPPLIEGQALSATSKPGDVVLNKNAKASNVKLGDKLKVVPTGQILNVVGFTNGNTYSHLEVVFMSISDWQSIKYAAPGSKGDITSPVSAVAVQMNESALAKLSAIPGVEVTSRDNAVEKLPGFSEESGSIVMILVFLVLIASFIMAAFFYVITLQKTNQFGILKALGASTGFLARDLMGQITFITVVGVLLGMALTYGVATIMPASVPFQLNTGMVATYSLILIGVSLAGSLLSLRRISKVDALIAIGRVD
jgi:putative ABC transport system permease protein